MLTAAIGTTTLALALATAMSCSPQLEYRLALSVKSASVGAAKYAVRPEYLA
jgi:hypothetical protein